MYVKGFKFYVLNNAFIMHKGFKWKKDFHKSRDLENQKVNILVLGIISDLFIFLVLEFQNFYKSLQR